MRIRGAKTELEEAGLDTDGMAESVSKLREEILDLTGVDLQLDEDTFKSTYQILKEISEVWDDLSDISRANITELLAGKRQGNILSALMTNFDIAEQVADTSANRSQGSAQKELANFQKGIEYSLGQFRAAFQEFSTDFITSDLVKGVVDFGTGIIDVLDATIGKFGALKTVIAGLGIAAIVTDFMGLRTAISQLITLGASGISTFSQLGVAFNSVAFAITGLIVAAAGVAAIVALFDHLHDSADEVLESFSKQKESFESAKLEVDDLNSQLEETQSKIDALEAKENLSLVEEEDLNNLREQNAQLETTIKLREAELKLEAKRNAQAAHKLFDEWTTEDGWFSNGGNNAYDPSKVAQNVDSDFVIQDIINGFLHGNLGGDSRAVSRYENFDFEANKDNINVLIAAYQSYQKQIEAIDKAEANLGDDQTDILNNLEEQRSKLEEQSLDAQGYIAGYADVMQSIKDAYTELEGMGEVLTTSQRSEMNSAQAFLTEYHKMIGDYAKEAQDSIKLIFSDPRFKNFEKRLQNEYKNGNVGYMHDLITDTPGFQELYQSYGVAPEQIEQYIANSVNPDELNIDKVKEQLKNLFSSDDYEVKIKLGEQADAEFDKFLEDKSDTEIEIFYKYVNAHDVDISKMTPEELESTMDIAIETSGAATSIDEVTEAFSDANEGASTLLGTIDSINSALSAQSTGKSIGQDVYNSEDLKDYQSALEYVNGTLQYNADKVKEITKNKVEEQIATNDAAKALQQAKYAENTADLEKMRTELAGINPNLQEYSDKLAEIRSLEADNSAIAAKCDYLNLLNNQLRESIGTYQAWKDAQNMGSAGDMASDVRSAMKNITDVFDPDSDMHLRIGEPVYKAAVDFLVPETVDSSDQTAVKEYIDNLGTYFTGDEEGTTKFISEAIDKGLMEYTPDGEGIQIAADKTMDDFANAFNWTDEATQAMFGDLETYGFSFSWADEANKTVEDLAVSAGEAVNDLSKLGGTSARIRVDVSDIESADEKVAVLDNTIAEVSQIRSTLSVDSSEYEEAQTVIAYCLAQKQQLEQPAVMQVDTSIVEGKIGEAITLLQQFQEAKNALDSKTALGMDTSGAQDSVNGLVESIKGLDPNITAALNIDTSSAETIAASIAELSPEVMVKAGIDDSAIIGYSPDDKKAKVIFGVDSTAVDNYTVSEKQGTVRFSPDDSAINTWIPPVKQGKVVYSASGGSDLNGTANVNGTAFTKGDWGATRTETALVGELGREIVVDSRTGKWHTVGDNGAEFTKINRGDIIFNHKQTEELLARGFVNGRGSAYLNGNAYVTGELKNSALLNKVKGYTPSETKANTDATVANTTATKEDTKQKTKNTKSAKKLGDLYDWVAVKLKDFADKTKAIADQINDYVTSAFKAGKLKDQITANQNEIGANQYAAWLYKDQANTVAKKTKMSKKLVNKAKSGAWEFENLSKKDKEKVTAYLKYYDKYKEATSKVQELRNEQLELYEQWANMPSEEASKKIEEYSNSLTLLSNAYNLATSGASALAKYAQLASKSAGTRNLDSAKAARNNAGLPSYVAANALLDKQKDNMQNQLDTYTTAYNQATANANSARANITSTKNASATAKANVVNTAKSILKNKKFTKQLSKSQEEALKKGQAVTTKGLSGKTLKQIKAYNQLVSTATTKANSAKDAATKYSIATKAQQEALHQLAGTQEEYAQMLVENEQKKFDNIKNFYDLEIAEQKQIADNAEKNRKYWEAYGNDVTEEQFQSQIDAMEAERDKMDEQRKTLEAQLKSAEENGIIRGSEEWLKMNNQLLALDGNINEINTSILEVQDSMRNEVFYQALDKALKKAEQLRGSLSTISGIISDEMMFDDDGRMTDFGITALAMNVKEYESYLDSMGDLLAKRQKYIDAFNDGNNSTNYSEKEFNEDIANIEGEIQNLLKNTDSARKTIIDMVTKASKAELDAIFKAIDARKELLKKQNDYYDYDKSLRDKTKDIQLLEQQERALQNSANAEDKAMLARIRAQKQEAQEALDDTVRDHIYNLQVEGLDDLKTELQDNYDKYVKDLSRNLDLITETVDDATDTVTGALTTVNDTVKALLSSYGVNGLTGKSIGLPTFASGSRRVGRNTYGLTNERAGEIVIGDRGVFVPLSASSAVVKPELTNRLFDLADNYNSIMSVVGKNGAIASIQSNEGNSITPIINAPISIVGNQIDEQGVIRAINKQLPIISRTVQEDIRKDLRKSR